MLHPTLFPTKYFPKGTFQPIVLPIASIHEVVKQKQNMSDFHAAAGVLQEKTVGAMKIKHSEIHKAKMIAFVTKGENGIIVFGRKGLTNFAEASIKLLTVEQLKELDIHSDSDISAFCSEMIFTLFKRQSTPGDPNFELITNTILLAPTPLHAKKATGPGKLDPFDVAKWDAMSMQAMYVSTVMRCTDETQFNLFKECTKMMRDEGVKTFLVIEANDDDTWGINRFTNEFLEGLYTTCTDDLIAAATELFRGENQLGKVFTDFMLAIEPMDYETYMRAIADVQFVTVAK